MKKNILIIILLFLIFCFFIGNLNRKTPERKVREYFNEYQTLSQRAIKHINLLVSNEESLTSSQKEKYRNVLKKHYTNLKYRIKDEKIVNDKAIVFAEIEVKNNIKVLKNAEYKKNIFIDNSGNLSLEKFNNYRINLLNNEKSTIKYEISFNLHVKNNKWVINKISDTTKAKMLGIYNEYI